MGVENNHTVEIIHNARAAQQMRGFGGGCRAKTRNFREFKNK